MKNLISILAFLIFLSHNLFAAGIRYGDHKEFSRIVLDLDHFSLYRVKKIKDKVFKLSIKGQNFKRKVVYPDSEIFEKIEVKKGKNSWSNIWVYTKTFIFDVRTKEIREENKLIFDFFKAGVRKPIYQFKENKEIKKKSSEKGKKKKSEEVSKIGQDQILFEKGKNLSKMGNFEEAIRSFSGLLLLYPNSPLVPDAIFHIATCYTRIAQSSKTETEKEFYLRKSAFYYSIIMKSYPESKIACEALYREALCYVEMGYIFEAKRLFEKLTTLFPESPFSKKARLFLADLYLKEGVYIKALVEYLMLEDHLPKDLSLKIKIANTAYIMGKYKIALKYYIKVYNTEQKLLKNDPETLINFCDTLLKNDKPKLAIELLIYALTRYPEKKPIIGSLLGNCYLFLKDYKSAFWHYCSSLCISKDPHLKGELMMRIADLALEAKDLKTLTYKKPLPCNFCLIYLNHPQKAYKEVAKKWKMEPLGDEALLKLAALLFDKKRFYEALSIYDAILKNYVKSSYAYRKSLLAVEKVVLAILREAKKNGDYIGAIKRFEENIHYLRDPLTYVAAADIYTKLCMYKEAQNLYTRASLKLGSCYDNLSYKISKTAFLLGKLEYAKREFLRYKRECGKPLTEDEYIFFLKLLWTERSYDKAFSIAKEILKKFPKTFEKGEFLEIYASLNYKKGLIKEASESYKKLYELTNDTRYLIMAADLNLSLGDFKMARSLYEKALPHIKGDDLHWVNLQLAFCYKALGNPEKSRELIKNIPDTKLLGKFGKSILKERD